MVNPLPSSLAHEVNFDGIPGPTHNYGGLSFGNIASMRSRETISSPRTALLQCLKKLDLLSSLGVLQALLPPQARPDFMALRRLGYSGSEEQILFEVAKDDSRLLASCYSSSNMWAANAATVSPSADTSDNLTHFTPANLVNLFHRSVESIFTGQILRRIFNDESKFAHHLPLPASVNFSDEGAANHSRFCSNYGDVGVELFVYGRTDFDNSVPKPSIYPARQTLEASQAVARLHRLDPERTVFARQNPDAIDSGVFHNDVIAVGNRNVLFFHSQAFWNSESVIRELREKFARHCNGDIITIEISQNRLPLTDAVESYLFNSQLVSMPDGSACLVAPTECQQNPRVKGVIDEIMSQDNTIDRVVFVDVRESMRNGGGPACQRLRVVLTEEELPGIDRRLFFGHELYQELVQWGTKNYRERLSVSDLADPQLLYENRHALDELTTIMGLGSIYDFQTE